MLALIYALPFILLSVTSCLVCVATPKLRKHSLPALVAPLAFGFCSITSMVAIVVGGDSINHPLPSLAGAVGILIFVAIYVIPGLVGAWLAVLFAGRLQRRPKS